MNKTKTTDASTDLEALSLVGKLLIAMPGMQDPNFHRTLVCLCAHSAEGAMGIVINRPKPDLSLDQLIDQLNIPEPYLHETKLAPPASEFVDRPSSPIIVQGGPVELGRGFVLHSNEFQAEETIIIDDELNLSSSVDALFALRDGSGPEQAIIALGYAGWGAGQLEREINQNGWIAGDISKDLLYDGDAASKYDRALKSMGIHPGALVADAGHA